LGISSLPPPKSDVQENLSWVAIVNQLRFTCEDRPIMDGSLGVDGMKKLIASGSASHPLNPFPT